jgi:hypothetical protein
VLICRPVCRRSSPQKIRRWIREMEQLRARHLHDPDACQVIDRCIDHASGWLETERA